MLFRSGRYALIFHFPSGLHPLGLERFGEGQRGPCAGTRGISFSTPPSGLEAWELIVRNQLVRFDLLEPRMFAEEVVIPGLGRASGRFLDQGFHR